MKKPIPTIALLAALSIASAAHARSNDMGNMGNMEKDSKNCQEMKGMHCQGMMEGMDKKHPSDASMRTSHQADAEVKRIDRDNGKVTLAHGPVKSLGWPAMSMNFSVHDKALLDKLAVGKKVHVEFRKQDADYVVTSVK